MSIIAQQEKDLYNTSLKKAIAYYLSSQLPDGSFLVDYRGWTLFGPSLNFMMAMFDTVGDKRYLL